MDRLGALGIDVDDLYRHLKDVSKDLSGNEGNAILASAEMSDPARVEASAAFMIALVFGRCGMPVNWDRLAAIAEFYRAMADDGDISLHMGGPRGAA